MKLKITLKRSFIGRPEKIRKILLSLGLKKVRQSVVQDDTPPIRGMIHKVSTLVEVTGIKDQEARKLKTAESKN